MTRACLFGENPHNRLSEEFALEPYSKVFPTCTKEQYLVAKGKSFSVNGVLVDFPDAGTTAWFLAKTPVGVCMDVHSLQIGTTVGPIDIYLYENPIISSVGSPIVPINTNRYLNFPAVTEVWSNPTITSTGNLIHRDQSTGEKHSGGTSGSLYNLFLRDNTYYLFGLQNNSVAVADIVYDFNWSEITTY